MPYKALPENRKILGRENLFTIIENVVSPDMFNEANV